MKIWASIMAPATPLLFLDDANAPNCQKNNGFSDLGNYSEWPKVAGRGDPRLLQNLA
jgi:hypothetical protein